MYCRMAFQLPETFSKPDLSRTTHLAYVRRLNQLAEAGFDTPEILLKKPFSGVSLIKKLFPGDDNASRNGRRYFISAIFYVLPLAYRKKSNPYSRLNAVSMPVDLPSEKSWVFPAKKFLAEQ